MEKPNHARLLAVTFCNDVLHTLPESERSRFEGTHQLGTVKMPERIEQFTWACRNKIETLKMQRRLATCPTCFNGGMLEEEDILGQWLDLGELPLAGVISIRDYWGLLLQQPEFQFLSFLDMPTVANDVTLSPPPPQIPSLDESAQSGATAEPLRNQVPLGEKDVPAQPPRPYTPLHLKPAEKDNEEE